MEIPGEKLMVITTLKSYEILGYSGNPKYEDVRTVRTWNFEGPYFQTKPWGGHHEQNWWGRPLDPLVQPGPFAGQSIWSLAHRKAPANLDGKMDWSENEAILMGTVINLINHWIWRYPIFRHTKGFCVENERMLYDVGNFGHLSSRFWHMQLQSVGSYDNFILKRKTVATWIFLLCPDTTSQFLWTWSGTEGNANPMMSASGVPRYYWFLCGSGIG